MENTVYQEVFPSKKKASFDIETMEIVFVYSFLLYFSLGHHLQLRFRILMEVKQITTKYQMEWEYQINSTLAFMKILQYKESLL